VERGREKYSTAGEWKRLALLKRILILLSYPTFPPDDTKQTQIPVCCGKIKKNPRIMYKQLNTLMELQSTVF
jgi:hypothetical protein